MAEFSTNEKLFRELHTLPGVNSEEMASSPVETVAEAEEFLDSPLPPAGSRSAIDPALGQMDEGKKAAAAVVAEAMANEKTPDSEPVDRHGMNASSEFAVDNESDAFPPSPSFFVDGAVAFPASGGSEVSPGGEESPGLAAADIRPPGGFRSWDEAIYADLGYTSDRAPANIQRSFGSKTVLIPLPVGTTCLPDFERESIAREKTQTPDSQAELSGSDIAVLCGESSQNLSALVFSGEQDLAEFLADNPACRGALITRNPKGQYLWLRITDYCLPTIELPPYRVLGRNSVVMVHTRLSGQEKYGFRPGVPSQVTLDAVEFRSEAAAALRFRYFEKLYGPPVMNRKLNSHFWAAFVTREGRIAYDPVFQKFFRVSSSGEEIRPEALMKRILSLVLGIGSAVGMEGLRRHTTSRELQAVLDSIKIIAAQNIPRPVDSLTEFIREWLVREKKANVTTAELFQSYLKFCIEREQLPMPERRFQIRIAEQIEREFHIAKCHRIKRNGSQCRGFEHIALKGPASENSVTVKYIQPAGLPRNSAGPAQGG